MQRSSILEIVTLEQAWQLANRRWLADSVKASAVFEQIVSEMRARGGYHSVSHIERMVAKYLQWCGVIGTDPDPRVLTWIFAHDLVYTPGAASNEEESAARMDELLGEMGAERRIERDDRTAIESTKSHHPVDEAQLDEPGLLDSIHLLHDLDLEILGSSRGDYDDYTAAVYAEYLAATHEPATFHQRWLAGRSAFLQAMLARGRIFKTPLFALFEQHARDNMAEELRLLGC